MTAIGRSDLVEDPRFATNSGRVTWRDTLCPLLQEVLLTRTSGEWLALFEKADVPAGPVNTVDRALSTPASGGTQHGARGRAPDAGTTAHDSLSLEAGSHAPHYTPPPSPSGGAH